MQQHVTVKYREELLQQAVAGNVKYVLGIRPIQHTVQVTVSSGCFMVSIHAPRLCQCHPAIAASHVDTGNLFPGKLLALCAYCAFDLCNMACHSTSRRWCCTTSRGKRKFSQHTRKPSSGRWVFTTWPAPHKASQPCYNRNQSMDAYVLRCVTCCLCTGRCCHACSPNACSHNACSHNAEEGNCKVILYNAFSSVFPVFKGFELFCDHATCARFIATTGTEALRTCE